jgi:hypothetical protein
MTVSLDLRTRLDDIVYGVGSLTRAMCVVHPDQARVEVCERSGPHPADAFMRLACGCTFAYCRTSLRNIYGPTLIMVAICPRHQQQDIVQADWIRALER